MKALSIKQPWAWLIVNGYKNIENRVWKHDPKYRGVLYIHAGKGCTQEEYLSALQFARGIDPDIQVPFLKDLPRGGIVGRAELTGCVRESDSPWYQGELGLVLENGKPLEFVECKGQLGIFEIHINPLKIREFRHGG